MAKSTGCTSGFILLFNILSLFSTRYKSVDCFESSSGHADNYTVYTVLVNESNGFGDAMTGLRHSVHIDVSDYFGAQLASHFTSLTHSTKLHDADESDASVEDRILPRCKAYLDLFGVAASRFTACAITNGRPMRFCERCIADYMITMDRYNEMEQDVYHDKTTGLTCKFLLLNADRIMIVQHAKNFVDDLWQRSHCNSCFAYSEYNKTTSSVTFEYDNSTVEFQKLLTQTEKCMNITEDLIITHVNKSVCDVCQSQYNALNEYYSEIEEAQKHEVCMDIADAMNMTRMRWSKTFNCTKKHRDVVPVLLLTVFFTFMPVMFYIGSKIHGVREERKIMKQKRMKAVVSSLDSSN